MDNNDIVYFELNNWSCGDYYPDAEPFRFLFTNLNYLYFFRNEEWIKDNKICVVE